MIALLRLEEHGTTVRREVRAGVTTFLTMSYIVVLNPLILSQAGMPADGVLAATCLAAALGSALMGLLTNYPFALAPGMGLNAFFTYTVVLSLGLPWQGALAAVFVSGAIFLGLTLTRLREAAVNAIPLGLKCAISVGIGFFIALIGLNERRPRRFPSGDRKPRPGGRPLLRRRRAAGPAAARHLHGQHRPGPGRAGGDGRPRRAPRPQSAAVGHGRHHSSRPAPGGDRKRHGGVSSAGPRGWPRPSSPSTSRRLRAPAC